jgi:ribosomal protein S26
VKAGLNAKAQLYVLGFVRGELQRVCEQLNMLPFCFSCAIEAAELNLRCSDERERQRDAEGKNATVHAPPAAMVF